MRSRIAFAVLLFILAMGLFFVSRMLHPRVVSEVRTTACISPIACSDNEVFSRDIAEDSCTMVSENGLNHQDTPGQPATCSLQGLLQKGNAPLLVRYP